MSGYTGAGTTFVGGAITSPLLVPDGAIGAPAIARSAVTTTGMYFSAANQLSLAIGGTNVIHTFSFLDVATAYELSANAGIAWSNTANNSTATADTGIKRNAAGVLEINSGTAGTFKDLKLQRQLVGGTAPTVASTGLGTGTVAVDAGSTDTAGIITLSPTGSPAGTGVVTLTFSAALGGNAGPAYICMPVNGTGAWQAQAVIIGTTLSTTVPTFTWTNGATPTALTAGSTYKIAYIAIGK